MLFGDAPRDSKMAVSRKGNGLGAHMKGNRTEDHLGPGAYYTSHNENIRAGWVRRSYSTKQPMSPTFEGKKERHKNYTDSVMNSKGNLLATGGSHSNSTPGPGHYNTFDEVMPLKRSPRAPFDPEQSSKLSPHGGIASGSPRVLHPSASLKDGILFHGKAEEHLGIGPGHYYNATSDKHMLKKSFNVRTRVGNSPTRRPGSAGRGRSSSPSHGYRRSSPSISPSHQEDHDYMAGLEAHTAQSTPFHD